MCCFSRPIKHVSATHIFARSMPKDRQALAYSMNVEIDDELAMVLPIPITVGCPEDSVSFIDLSAYPKLFTDMRGAFPEMISRAKSRGIFAQRGASRPKLAVHDVGAFVASFVPTPRDFDRLDDRFRLSPTVFEARAEYKDYGFAVFQLKPSRGWFGRIKRQTIHPMAFTFPSRRPRALFYPTLHVHDGEVPEVASFDHSLYCQSDDELLLRTLPFEQSEKPIGDHVDAKRTAGLVDGTKQCLRNVVMWQQKNADHWYDPPECAGAHVLRGKGELFAFQLAATAAYYTAFDQVRDVENSKRLRRWQRTARTKLDALHAGLSEGLRTMTSERREDWNLAPLTADAMEESYLAGNDNVFSTRAREQGSSKMFEPGQETLVRVKIAVHTDDVEPQNVELGFLYVPTPEVIAEIRTNLIGIINRAVA